MTVDRNSHFVGNLVQPLPMLNKDEMQYCSQWKCESKSSWADLRYKKWQRKPSVRRRMGDRRRLYTEMKSTSRRSRRQNILISLTALKDSELMQACCLEHMQKYSYACFKI